MQRAVPLRSMTLSPQATASENAVTLQWQVVTGAQSYCVLRATAVDGNYRDVSGELMSETFEDDSAPRGSELWCAVELAGYDAALSKPTYARVLDQGARLIVVYDVSASEDVNLVAEVEEVRGRNSGIVLP